MLYIGRAKNEFRGVKEEQRAPVQMQSTINNAIKNAFAQLSLSDTFRDKLIAHLWRLPAVSPNVEKLNRQQVQKLEELARQSGEVTEEKILHKNFLAYVNGMTAETFKSKSLVEHMRDHVVPPEDDDEDIVDVNFHLRDYVVGIKTHRVYEMRGGVHVFVGYLGKNEFKEMVMPEYD